MKFDLQNKDGLTLKTKGKYVKEDIAVGLSESDKSALIPENMVEEASVLGVQGSLKKFDGTFEGEAKVEVNELKRLLDYTKSCFYMFYGNKAITDLTGYIDYNDTENVTNMYSMFNGCSKLEEIPPLNTSKVTNMSYMFNGCIKLKTLPAFNTSSVTNMYSMFNNCSNLKTLPPLNTSKVTNMSNMFNGCSALTALPLLDTSNVTDMNYMFNGCSKLEEIPPLNTSKVTNMSNMFFNCTLMKKLPPLDTSNVTDMHGFFSNQQGWLMDLIEVPRLDTTKVTDLSFMFWYCHKLPKIDISYYNISSTSKSDQAFANNYSLKTVLIRGFGSTVLHAEAFYNCYHFTGYQQSTYNPTGAKDGYIYVPRNMCDTLKSATNWSTYADQIRALEDYTVDGTTTGDLDESKVNA